MFGDIIEKMKVAQEESKEKLARILVDGQTEGGGVKVVVNGNREVKQVYFTAEFWAQAEKEEVEELTMIALNRALEKAEKMYTEEMSGAAKGMMPNIPGMGNLFGK
ncbi:MAG: YbaB/EbfC family nucleoid-associated protein [Bacteroidales bacterium]|nr:YbaB/EbfC family nucleoid-associated protein [Bacteroidales bacterium]